MLLLICLVVLIFQSDIPNINALPMDNYQGEMVTEELRLKVPSEAKEAWLNAEKEIWDLVSYVKTLKPPSSE